MGKSARARKAKKADFQKVKLKVGRRLPRAQNATDTTFRSRKIVISQQHKLPAVLSDSLDKPCSTDVNLQFKDLLTRLRNFGAGTVGGRCETLDKLNALLSHRHNLIVTGLSCLLPVIGGLLSHLDQRVRDKAQTVLITCICSASNESSTLPTSLSHVHADCVSTHLVYALTHLDCDVRQSALSTLTKLLACESGKTLLITCLDRLLPCLFEQLPSAGNKDTRRDILLDNPSVRLSKAAWRYEVMLCIADLLDHFATPTETINATPNSETNRLVFNYPGDGTYLSLFSSPISGTSNSDRNGKIPGSNSRCRLLCEPKFTRHVISDALSCLRRCFLEIVTDSQVVGNDAGVGVSIDTARLLIVSLRCSLALLRLSNLCNTSVIGTKSISCMELCDKNSGDLHDKSNIPVWLVSTVLKDSVLMSALRLFPIVYVSNSSSDKIGDELQFNINRLLSDFIVTLFTSPSKRMHSEISEALCCRVLHYIRECLMCCGGKSNSSSSSHRLDRYQQRLLLKPFVHLLANKECLNYSIRRQCVHQIAEFFSRSPASNSSALPLSSHETVKTSEIRSANDESDFFGVELFCELVSDRCLSLWYNPFETDISVQCVTSAKCPVLCWAGVLLQKLVSSRYRSTVLIDAFRRLAFIGPPEFLWLLESVVGDLLVQLGSSANYKSHNAAVSNGSFDESISADHYNMAIVNLLYPIRKNKRVRDAVLNFVAKNSGGSVSDADTTNSGDTCNNDDMTSDCTYGHRFNASDQSSVYKSVVYARSVLLQSI